MSEQELPTFREIAEQRIADARPADRTINIKVAINTARMMAEREKEERHSLRVALMAAEATLSMVTRVTHNIEYIEVRRKETIGIVRKALAEMDGNWVEKVFKPLPEDEAKLLREYGP